MKSILLTVMMMFFSVAAALAPGHPFYENPSYDNPPFATYNFQTSSLPVHDRTVYSSVYQQKNLFINISKEKRTLYVYERRCTGMALVAAYPVCIGANTGHKKIVGDHRTPETTAGKPFIICSIENSSSWKHNFGDGRGSMPAYGNWFLRLDGDFPGSGIGIHGSTSNRYSIPGRGSEGCIRLRDEDIVHLKENYAFVGMKVYIERDL